MNKQAALIAIPLFLLGLAAQAETQRTNRIGVNGAYSTGGDVAKPAAGYGFQAEVGLHPNWGLELALSQTSDQSTDEGIEINQDLTSVGLSLVGRLPLTERLQVYGLLGVDYNMPSSDVTLDPSVYGPGWRAAVQLDDAWGVHGGLGLGLTLGKHAEVFLEYRYTGLELKGTMAVGDGTFVFTDRVNGRYDFGLVKLGINILF